MVHANKYIKKYIHTYIAQWFNEVRVPLISIFTLADRKPESNNGCGPLEKKKV
jgi:hypothetical protein